MTWTSSSKGYLAINAYPRTFSWILLSVGGLAVFLILGSCILLSNPIGSTVRGYFYGVDRSQKLDFSGYSGNPTVTFHNVDKNDSSESNSQAPTSSSGLSPEEIGENFPSDSTLEVSTSPTGSSIDVNVEVTLKNLSHESNSQVPPYLNSTSPSTLSDVEKMKDLAPPVPDQSSDSTREDWVKDGSYLSNVTDSDQIGNSISMGSVNNSSILDMGTNDTVAASFGSKSGDAPAFSHDSPLPSNSSRTDAGCDLYQGSWIFDSLGPVYTNNTCPILTQMQNCQGNGRPDKDYENWRWKPEKCDLPRFDGRKFLDLMRGKTIAFIGDSVARNQMESLLCMLWQVEVPKNRGNKKMQRYYFRSTSVMVVRMWSSWLVKQTSEAVDFAPEGVVKLHLDAPDDSIMEHITNFDVIVLSSGHWFAKQSVYLLNNKIVGGQLWWPDKSRPMKINNIEAFGISVETIVAALGTNPNYTGLAIVRSFSPDHYEGGQWNTGGSCTGKTKPLAAGEIVENGFTNIMHEKQVTGFNRAIKKVKNKSKMRLMDITRVFEYRHDGHPGPYRNTDPNKLTKRGPDGKPPPQDCLHWCMPGPVDTWNELVLEIIRREYENTTSFSS
ncbi:hypothetical protein L484_012975 [Morus notabilis]|uniref:Uncharacterized protein n=1 Tax=Morus notabilis TaxID=981085 RepID=W9S1G9_9ROSA|nr:protein YLS7 [Morus notabilis]EXC20899.1 hypothetical protein L484_012975 [Morus notabilis]